MAGGSELPSSWTAAGDVVLWCVEGSTEVMTQHGTASLQAGHALWVPEGTTVSAEGSATVLPLGDGTTSLSERLDARDARHRRAWALTPEQQVGLLRLAMMWTTPLRPVGYHPDLAWDVVARWARIGCCSPAPTLHPRACDPAVAHVAACLRAHPESSRGIEEWAQLSGLTVRTLQRRFREATGTSLRAYRATLRSCPLLEATLPTELSSHSVVTGVRREAHLDSLVWCLTGRVLVTIDNRIRTVEPGQVVTIPAGTAYQLTCEAQGAAMTMIFAPGAAREVRTRWVHPADWHLMMRQAVANRSTWRGHDFDRAAQWHGLLASTDAPRAAGMPRLLDTGRGIDDLVASAYALLAGASTADAARLAGYAHTTSHARACRRLLDAAPASLARQSALPWTTQHAVPAATV